MKAATTMVVWVLALSSLCLGCSPTVGDACETSTACGTGLICDLATPGGYCTRSPCRAGECPAESVCVDFGAEASWCMRRCDGGEGCREGLACLAPDVLGGSTACLDADLKGGCRFCAVQP